MTPDKMHEINLTAVDRLARARRIPVSEARAWLDLAVTAFRRREDQPGYRDDQLKPVSVSKHLLQK